MTQETSIARPSDTTANTGVDGRELFVYCSAVVDLAYSKRLYKPLSKPVSSIDLSANFYQQCYQAANCCCCS